MTRPARRIRVLPDSVANQIAAGEVVERPASVVKELVENALDAGAAHIRVEVEQGGKQRIRVIDDGAGMGREDAILSLERHATSKITSARELRAVASFGFRGEALPSIAAVSRLTLETSDGSSAGTRIRATGGRITRVEDHARARGTTLEAANLFFNAPARRRFLKTTSAETRAVAAELTSLALAHPSVAFTLTSGDHVLLELPRDPGPARRFDRVWGDDAGASMFSLAGESDVGQVSGLLQRPDRARPGSRRAFLFLGGRPFRDKGLNDAVQRAYRTTIREAVRPWFLLYIDVPPGQVDVNVHPAKLEVRFRNRAAVEGFIEEEVRRALAGEESAATVDSVPPPGCANPASTRPGTRCLPGSGPRSLPGSGSPSPTNRRWRFSPVAPVRLPASPRPGKYRWSRIVSGSCTAPTSSSRSAAGCS